MCWRCVFVLIPWSAWDAMDTPLHLQSFLVISRCGHGVPCCFAKRSSDGFRLGCFTMLVAMAALWWWPLQALVVLGWGVLSRSRTGPNLPHFTSCRMLSAQSRYFLLDSGFYYSPVGGLISYSALCWRFVRRCLRASHL